MKVKTTDTPSEAIDDELGFKRRPKINTTFRVDLPRIKKIARVERKRLAEVVDAAIDEYFSSRTDPEIRMIHIMEYVEDTISLIDLRGDMEELNKKVLELRLGLQKIKDICDVLMKD